MAGRPVAADFSDQRRCLIFEGERGLDGARPLDEQLYSLGNRACSPRIGAFVSQLTPA
jgi:hypothetical protein